MFKTLYKSSHFIASGILVLAVSIGSATAMNVSSAPAKIAKAEVPTLGRFVVSATSSVFVPASPEVR